MWVPAIPAPSTFDVNRHGATRLHQGQRAVNEA